MKKFITPSLTIVAMQNTAIIAASNDLDININETDVNPEFGIL